jgi:hypothetical protein
MRPRRIASPKKPPRAAPRMVFHGVPELPETAAAGVCVGVSVADAEVAALADVDTVEEMMNVEVDVELDVAVAEDDVVDSVESSLIWPSLELASSQLFSLALYMHSTSSAFPPAMTTVSSDP